MSQCRQSVGARVTDTDGQMQFAGIGTVFYVAAGVVWLGAASLMWLTVRADTMATIRPVALVLSVLMVPMGCAFLVLPTMARLRVAGAEAFRSGLMEVNARWSDLEAVRREHYKARTATELLAASLTEESQRLSTMQRDLQETIQDRRRMDEEISRHRQETANVLRRMEEWQEGNVAFVRALERVVEESNGQVSLEVVKAHEKSIDDFVRCMRPLGFEVIRPGAGAPFDERIHCIEGEEESASIAPGHIVRSVAWGFQLRGGVDRARVILAKAAVGPTSTEHVTGALSGAERATQA